VGKAMWATEPGAGRQPFQSAAPDLAPLASSCQGAQGCDPQ